MPATRPAAADGNRLLVLLGAVVMQLAAGSVCTCPMCVCVCVCVHHHPTTPPPTMQRGGPHFEALFTTFKPTHTLFMCLPLSSCCRPLSPTLTHPHPPPHHADVFGVYSQDLKNGLRWTQSDVQLVGSVGNVGLYVGLFAGAFYDRCGALRTAGVGTVLASSGYLLAYLRTAGSFAGTPSVLVMSLFMALAWHGGAWLDCAAVTTAVKLFPANRGLIVGVVKSFFGLSASILSQLFLAFFDDSTPTTAPNATNATTNTSAVACPGGAAPRTLSASKDTALSAAAAAAPPASAGGAGGANDVPEPVKFLLVLSVFTLVVGAAAGSLLSERYNGSVMRRAEIRRVNSGYLIIALLAVYLAVAAALEHKFPNNPELNIGTFCGMCAILVPLMLLPWGTSRLGGRGRGSSRGAIVVDGGDRAGDDAEGDDEARMLGVGPSPPSSVKPEDGADVADVDGGASNTRAEMSVVETLTSLDFYLLWLSHFCGTANGLFFINNVAQIEQAMGGTKASAALYVSIIGAFNAFGRMAAGWLSDRFSNVPRPAFFVASLVVMALGQASMAVLPSTGWLYVASAIVGFTYGTFWALIPPMCIELFGAKNVGLNYQMLGLAPAAGSVLASVVLAGSVYQAHTIPGTTLCCGPACFGLTHWVTSGAALLGALAAVGLYFRTRSWYAGRGVAVATTVPGRGRQRGPSYGRLGNGITNTP